MAFDFLVGRSDKIKDNPTIVGGIEFDEYPTLCSLVKKTNIDFLFIISNLFEDCKFDLEYLQNARLELLALLPTELSGNERNFIHKIIAVISYSLMVDKPLFGVAD